MSKIKVGIIGTGFIGPVHIEALRRTGLVEITAIADINQKTADAKAVQLGVDKAYGDYRELLKNNDIQSVHICTPNSFHYTMTKEALEAGKHVMCEKPLAMLPKEGEELLKIANAKKLAHATHFNVRFYPLIHQAKKMVGNGELGEIFAINGSYQQDWLFFPTDYSWRLEPEFSGKSRAIADIGSHWIDTIEFITGCSVKKVCADFATFYPVRKKPLKPMETFTGKILSQKDYADVKINTEDYASVLLRFNNGAHGSFTVNQVAAGRKNRIYFEIYGSKKSIAWSSESPNEMWFGRRDGTNEQLLKDPSLLDPMAREITSYPGGHNEGFPDTSKQFFIKFYKYIAEKAYEKGITPEFPTFEAGLREMVLCENIVESALKENWIEIL
jgi:predicted dehydrogenase